MICIDKCDYINANGRTFAIGLRNIVELLNIRLKNVGSNTQLLKDILIRRSFNNKKNIRDLELYFK